VRDEDLIVVGVLIGSVSFGLYMKPSTHPGHRAGYRMRWYIGLRRNMSEPTRELVYDYLERHDIHPTAKGRIGRKPQILLMLDLLEPWRPYFPDTRVMDALRFVCENDVPYNSEDEFWDYMRHVDSLL
jgi:hypothetical protein